MLSLFPSQLALLGWALSHHYKVRGQAAAGREAREARENQLLNNHKPIPEESLDRVRENSLLIRKCSDLILASSGGRW